MRKLYKNFITEDEAKDLIKTRASIGAQTKLTVNNNPIVKRVVDKLIKDFGAEIRPESYTIVEDTRENGHGWHVDTGRSEKIPLGHMEWCQVGATILLTNGKDGGDTYYADDHKETNKVKVDRNLYDLCAHSSDQWHMVEGTTGGRTVLLVFI